MRQQLLMNNCGKHVIYGMNIDLKSNILILSETFHCVLNAMTTVTA